MYTGIHMKKPKLSPYERGYTWEYRQARQRLLADQPPCIWCGQPATTADHYPPLKYGGHWESMVPACKRCNSAHVAAKRWLSRQHTTRDW